MQNVIEKQQTDISQLRPEIKTLIQSGISENTKKAYQRALQGIENWKPLGEPLSDSLLAAYLTELHQKGISPSTISQVVAAVKWQLKHQVGEDFPMPITNATLAGIRRDGKERGRGQVDGLIWQDVERVCILAETEGTLAGLRDSAMIRLMSDCLLRISEVVAVNKGDLKAKTLMLKTSKSDQEGRGQSLYVCATTRSILTQYRERSGIQRGALFRQIRRGDNIQKNRLHHHSARRIIQKRATNAGVDGFISGHSLRVGSAVSLASAGASVVDMQVAGRWKSPKMPAHYAKAELAERGAIARYKDGKTL
jgi:site-specific recombinase XerD